ncbi:MAG: GGDEF domain-containing protein [Myxococcales bacterium]|nr:GGDEF domain-containing protein [Myxococcales bacterium]
MAPSDPPLVPFFVALHRGSRRALPLFALLGVACLVGALGSGRLGAGSLANAGFGLVGLAIAGALGVGAHRRTRAVEQNLRRDVEVGAWLVLGAYAAALYVDRTIGGATYPLVYVALGLLCAFAHPVSATLVVAISVAFEALLVTFAFDALVGAELVHHALFMIAIAAVNLLSLRLEVARLRKVSVAQLDTERDKLREEARHYRLLRPTSPNEGTSAPAEGTTSRENGAVCTDDRLIRSGIEEIQLSVLFALRLLRQSLGLHTAMLLWLNERGTKLRISELVSDADDEELREGPFSAADGILGMALAQRAPVSIGQLKSQYVLPYYQDACPAQTVCAVPVFQHGVVRGVLVVDSARVEPFSRADEELCEQAARFCARAIENERVFVQLERTRLEQAKLYRAADRLGAAKTEQEVVEAGVLCARDIAAVDFAAFTAYDKHDDSHLICAVSGDGPRALEGKRFASNTGLCAMALRNRHALPYRGDYDAGQQTVFSKELAPPEMPSLLVLPLVVHDEALGTLVLGSRRAHAFDDTARGLLEVLGSHLAVSLSNARMVKRLEEQATTDGLTGLLNKRAMLETAVAKLNAAKRFARPLSVLVCDIDLFKRVNDTYGHDIGDVVIQQLAQLHESMKRATDSVARFGGEEFVTICEQTDEHGALLLAERIREEFGRTTIHAGDGREIVCTCSVGVATYPAAGQSWEDLFKAADAALYASKRGGRNRTTAWTPRLRADGHAAA